MTPVEGWSGWSPRCRYDTWLESLGAKVPGKIRALRAGDDEHGASSLYVWHQVAVTVLVHAA